MRRSFIVAVAIFMSIAIAGDSVVVDTVDIEPVVIVEEVKDDDASSVDLNSPKGPLPAAVGEPIKWAANNIDCWKGWSLTGHSWGGLTKNYNPWRFKIGIVSGEWEASRQKWMADNEKWAGFRRHETRMNDDVVLGVSFTIVF